MSQSSFFVTLSSNSSSPYFQNTPSNFKVQLAQNLELEGKWEVGLTEITFQQSWKNLDSDCHVHLWYRAHGVQGIFIPEHAKELAPIFEILQKNPVTALDSGDTYKLHKI